MANSVVVGLDAVLGLARRLILEQEGLYSLMPRNATDAQDFFSYYQSCDDEMFPTVLEALVAGLLQADELESRQGNWPKGWATEFVRSVNVIFEQERVGWELIEGLMVDIESKELHTAVVHPALRLLHTRKYSKADKQYRDALDELSRGKAADAITDAGATLQEFLEALGCEGNQLGDLAKSARKKGLLGAHDTPLLDALEKTLHWVAADRSQMGDAHHATAATTEDAWLIVHVVGALIVRLASGQTRSP